MTAPLSSEADLAEILGIPEPRVAELRRRYHWPHVRIGRTFRFTPAHIEQIIAGHSETPEGDPQQAVAALAGQTSRSASRRRSA